jgi:hypothetical protein
MQISLQNWHESKFSAILKNGHGCSDASFAPGRLVEFGRTNVGTET